MVLEIAFFLLGASLLLSLATPFALRYEAVRRARLVLVVVGGLLGVVPTVSAVGSAGNEGLRALRESSLGYSSDELAIASVLVFLVAMTVFTAAANSRRNGREPRVSRFITGTVCVALAVAVAGGLVGAGLYATGLLEQVAALYGRESPRDGLALVLAWSLLTGVGIALLLEIVDAGRYASHPTAGTVLGLLVALVGWFVGVLFVLPVWMGYAFDVSLAIPYLHWESLIGVTVFALVFGVCYPLLRRFVGLTPAREGDAR